MSSPGEAVRSLDVSVCVCTYNRRERLLEALHSLERVRVPNAASFEVLVVDNNSCDGTAEALRSLDSGNLPLRYVLEARQGLSHARNRCVSESRGRVVAFLDDDVVVECDWLEMLLEAFSAEPPPAAVGGPAYLATDLSRPSWWHEEFAGVAGHFDRGPAVLRSDEGYQGMIGIGANLAFDRRVFERYGEFRSDLGRTGESLAMGEELEFLDRLRRGGERLVYDPAVVVHHRPDLVRLTRSYLRRWYFRFGEWRFVTEGDSRAARLLDVPRWRFRHAVEESARWLYALLTRRPAEAFLHQLNVVAFGGYLTRAWSRRSGG
jgi:glycosyltransferase involved in cell wall biosynthesis